MAMERVAGRVAGRRRERTTRSTCTAARTTASSWSGIGGVATAYVASSPLPWSSLVPSQRSASILPPVPSPSDRSSATSASYVQTRVRHAARASCLRTPSLRGMPSGSTRPVEAHGQAHGRGAADAPAHAQTPSRRRFRRGLLLLLARRPRWLRTMHVARGPRELVRQGPQGVRRGLRPHVVRRRRS